MRRQTLTELSVLMLAVATLLMTINVMTIRKQQLTRQDVREIVDSVLIEVYD